jgi:hypothetical protein
MSDLILQAQQENKIRALVLHETSSRPTRTVALGGFLFRASLSRGWPARNLLTTDGAMMVLEAAPNEFYVLGSGLTVSFVRDPDVDDQIAGIASIEQGAMVDGKWATVRQLNGDQSNQGRELSMAPHEVRIYRVKLYTYGGKH